VKISDDVWEIIHCARCLIAGFNLDFNEFTLAEQDMILYTVNGIKNKQKEEDIKGWMKFLTKGFNSVCKTIAKAFSK
jgi:hypothetical protein